MKRIAMVLVMAVVVMVFSGCAGVRTARFTPDKDGSISYHDTNLSVLEPSLSPTEVTTAYAIKSDADSRAALTRAQIELYKAQVELLRKRTDLHSGLKKTEYVGCVVNSNLSKTMVVDYPDMDFRVTVPPGQSAIILTKGLPDEITIRAGSGYKVFRTYKKEGVYDGIPYDWGIRVF